MARCLWFSDNPFGEWLAARQHHAPHYNSADQQHGRVAVARYLTAEPNDSGVEPMKEE